MFLSSVNWISIETKKPVHCQMLKDRLNNQLPNLHTAMQQCCMIEQDTSKFQGQKD